MIATFGGWSDGIFERDEGVERNSAVHARRQPLGCSVVRQNCAREDPVRQSLRLKRVKAMALRAVSYRGRTDVVRETRQNQSARSAGSTGTDEVVMPRRPVRRSKPSRVQIAKLKKLRDLDPDHFEVEFRPANDNDTESTKQLSLNCLRVR